MHEPNGLGRETSQKLLVKVLELDEQTRHTLVRRKHGDDQEKKHPFWNPIWVYRPKIHRRPQVEGRSREH